MLENLWQDLRGGMRNLFKSPGFTLVAVLSLSLGIGAKPPPFSPLLMRSSCTPLPVEEPSRLAEAFTHDTLTIDANANFQLTGTSLPNYEDYRDRTRFSPGWRV